MLADLKNNAFVWREGCARKRMRWDLAIVGLFLSLLVIFVGGAKLYGVAPGMPLEVLAVQWTMVLCFSAIVLCASSYPREIERGTLLTASLTGMTPRREVLGRYCGAMLPVLYGWLVSGTLVALAIMERTPLGPSPRVILVAWLFVGCAAALFGALAFTCSTQARTTLEGFLCTVGVVLANTIALTWSAGVCGKALPLLFPSNLAAFIVGTDALYYPQSAFGGTLTIGGALMMSAVWLAAAGGLLLLAAALVRHGEPLRAAARQATPAGCALLPAIPHTVQKRVPVARRARLIDCLPGTLRHNPFYIAFRRGWQRVHGGATPGSILSPALISLGLVTSFFAMHASACQTYAIAGVCGSGLVETSKQILFLMLSAALCISAFEGFMVGSRALASERDLATWPLLIVSGLRPAQVLNGKLMTGFCAMSGEWLVVMPLWILYGLSSGRPAIALLSLAQPTVIFLSILCGLCGACSTRIAQVSARPFITAVLACMVVTVCLLPQPTLASALASCGAWIMLHLNPAMVLHHFTESPMAAAQGLSLLVFQLDFLIIMSAFTWLIAHARLSRLMAGESDG